MDFFNDFIFWGFRLLVGGAFAAVVYEMRDRRKSEKEMQKEISNINERLRDYALRSEIDTRIQGVVANIERMFRSLEDHLNEKFRWFEKAIDKKT